jgi:hypothetical protein
VDSFIQRVLVVLKRMWASWLAFPEQVKRLVVLLVIVVAVFIPVRNRLVPETFGDHGHYRAAALDEIAALPVHYAGRQVCYDCHDDIVEKKSHGYHRDLSCEICHGPAAQHTEAPDEFIPPAPRERGYCPLCHGYLASRPTGFPQIITASHNPLKPCITCHDPHNPVPPQTPKECEACHAAIAHTKAASHHVYVACTECHNAPEAHRVSPRQNPPSKPSRREDCGRCHSRDAEYEGNIKTIDMDTHGERYVCWQCHYPHMPEAQ